MFCHQYISILISCFLFITADLPTCAGCNGFTLSGVKIQNCAGITSQINVQNLTVTLDSKCSLQVNGCVTNAVPIRTISITCSKTRNGVTTQKTFNGCQSLAQHNQTILMPLMALDLRCPLNVAKTTCGSRTMNLSQYKENTALLAGQTSAVCNMTSDSGFTCIKSEGSLVRIASGRRRRNADGVGREWNSRDRSMGRVNSSAGRGERNRGRDGDGRNPMATELVQRTGTDQIEEFGGKAVRGSHDGAAQMG